MEKLAKTPENMYHDLDARRRTNLHTDEQLRSNLDAWIGAPEEGNDQAQKDLIAYLESRPIAVDKTGRLYEKANGKKINLENANAKISEGSETIDSILGPKNFAVGRHKKVESKTQGEPESDVSESGPATESSEEPKEAAQKLDESQFSPVDLERADVLINRLEDFYNAKDAANFESAALELISLVKSMVEAKGVDPAQGRLMKIQLLRVIESYEAEGKLSGVEPIESISEEEAVEPLETIPDGETEPIELIPDIDKVEPIELVSEGVKVEPLELIPVDDEPAETAEEPAAEKIEPIELIEETAEERRARLASSIELPKALTDQLDVLRDVYVKWSVDRSGRNFKSKNQLERAAEHYGRARDAVGRKLDKMLEQAGATPEDRLYFAKIAAAGEVFKTDYLIKDALTAQSENKKFKKFYDFWANQQTGGEGFKERFKEMFKKGNRAKTAKKAAAMGLITAIPVLGVGAATAVVAGTLLPGAAGVVGGVVGGFTSKGITKAQFSRKADKESEALTRAEVMSQSRMQGANEVIQNAGGLDDLKFSKITERFNKVTESIVKGNRNRMLGSVAAGAVAGVVGGVIGNALATTISGRGPSVSGRVNFNGSAGSSEANTIPVSSRPDEAITGTTQPQGSAPSQTSEVPAVPRPDQAAEGSRPQGPAASQPANVVDLRPSSQASPQFEVPADFNSNMPYENAVEVFHNPNPEALIQATLDEYNARTGQNFVWESGGNRGFRLGSESGRYINPAELAHYNQIMLEIMNRSLEENTLPAAA